MISARALISFWNIEGKSKKKNREVHSMYIISCQSTIMSRPLHENRIPTKLLILVPILIKLIGKPMENKVPHNLYRKRHNSNHDQSFHGYT